MARSLSPLRYPGGKAKIYGRVKNLIEVNGFGDRTYIEPFAGGFAIGINLLVDGIIDSAMLNDYDTHIYHFWHSVMNDTERLLKKISDTPVTVEERSRQKTTYKDEHSSMLDDGFATLFLNRVNFSGVLNGGPIGGLNQEGAYKIDCRFNKEDIAKKIETAAAFSGRIKISNVDGGELIAKLAQQKNRKDFYNIDPPYVIKGSRLYANYFKEQDHRKLGAIIKENLTNIPWIVTYDDCDLIREIYKGLLKKEYEVQHNVCSSFTGRELVVTNLRKSHFYW